MAHNPNTLISWLDHLKILLPPAHVTLVGAGNGKGVWAQWLQAQSVPSTLIEADAQQFSTLQSLQVANDLSQFTLLNITLAPDSGSVDFFTASLPAENGLLRPENLCHLWPNLHTLAVESQQATTLTALLQEEKDRQWLLLDCLPAAALLWNAKAVLLQVDVVVARVLLGQENPLKTAEAGLAELGDALPEFTHLAQQPTCHPGIAYALFVRDYNSAWKCANDKNLVLQEQLEKLQALNFELLEKHELQMQDQLVLNADLEKMTQTHEIEKSKLTQQLMESQKDLERLQSEIVQKGEFQVFFKQQSDDLIRVRKFLDASLKKEINNATRQIQAFTGLENYWRTGELPTTNTEGHGWPVSPDFSLYLISLLEQNDYDLVIEFGSGISTVVIAKTLAKLEAKQAKSTGVVFASFDHLRQYYQQTLSMLQQAGLASRVRLLHAPLEDWKAPNGNTYPYYACEEALAALTQEYPPAGLRVLVIVDGPPAATGPQARYPAGPLILQYFLGAHIDFLMDDYIREDEKKIAKLWRDEITAAQIPNVFTERKLERDACLLQVSTSSESDKA